MEDSKDARTHTHTCITEMEMGIVRGNQEGTDKRIKEAKEAKRELLENIEEEMKIQEKIRRDMDTFKDTFILFLNKKIKLRFTGESKKIKEETKVRSGEERGTGEE